MIYLTYFSGDLLGGLLRVKCAKSLKVWHVFILPDGFIAAGFFIFNEHATYAAEGSVKLPVRINPVKLRPSGCYGISRMDPRHIFGEERHIIVDNVKVVTISAGAKVPASSSRKVLAQGRAAKCSAH